MKTELSRVVASAKRRDRVRFRKVIQHEGDLICPCRPADNYHDQLGGRCHPRSSSQELLSAHELDTIALRFRHLMDLANRHDIAGIHNMFWQSPSALLVAKSAIPSEGNWAGFWGLEAIDQKLHDIASSGPVVLEPDFSRLKVVGITREVAESYAPVNITVSYAGQEGTPKPFLMIITWKKIASQWKIASEVILPVPPVPAGKG